MMKRLLLLMLLLCNIVVGAKADKLFGDELPFLISTEKATTLTDGYYVMQNKDNSRYIYADGDAQKLFFRSDPKADATSVVRITVSGNTCTLQTFHGQYFAAMVNNEDQVSTTADAAAYTWEYSSAKKGFRFSTNSVYMSRSGNNYPKAMTSTYWAAFDEAYFFLFPVTLPTGSALGQDVNYLPNSTPATSLNAGSIYAIKNVGNGSYMKAQSGSASLSTSSDYSLDNFFRVVNDKNMLNQTPSLTGYLETFYGNFVESIDALSDGAAVPVSSSTEAVTTAGVFDLTLKESTDRWFISSNTGTDIGVKHGNQVLPSYSTWRSAKGQGEYQFFEVRTEEISPLFSSENKTWEVSSTAATTLTEGYYVMQNVNQSQYVIDNASSYNLAFSATNTAKENIVQIVSTGTAGHYYIKSYSGRYVSPLVDALEATRTGVRTDYNIAATSTEGEFYIIDGNLYLSRNGDTYPRGVAANWKDNENEGHWKFYPVEFTNIPLSAETEYTVQVRNATGKEYNGIYDNHSRYYTNWYCTVKDPDLYTMTLQATFNNLAFRHLMEDNTSEYADGAFVAAYGDVHAPIVLTAPDGWYIKSVRMRGVSIGNIPNYIGSTDYKKDLQYSKTSDGTVATISPSNFYDFINATTGTIDDGATVYVGGEETGAATALLNGGTCYHVFKAANSYLGLSSVAEAMASDSVTEFTHTFSNMPTSWSFHVNGSNSSQLVMQMWVTLVKCDEVAGITVTVKDEDGTTTLATVKRNVRFGPQNQVYVPYDLRRDFFTATVLEDRATIEQAGTCTVQYSNNELPFRTIPNASLADLSTADVKANLYYMGFGPSNAPRFISYEADEAPIPFADKTEDVKKEWFGFSGDPYNGYYIVNAAAGVGKYLTSGLAADAVQPVMTGTYDKSVQTRRWYPQRAVNTHSDGKKYGGNYGITLPSTAASHFYLTPVKDDGKSFADCDVTWHYNRLGNCTEGALTYQIGRDEANQKCAVSIYEIRDWEVKLVNSEFPDYEDGMKETVLQDVRELETLKLQDSHLARDFITIEGSVTGDNYNHTTAAGFARYEFNYTNSLFRVTPDAADPIYYGMAIRYDDWHYLKYDDTKNYIPVQSTSDVDAAAFIGNNAAQWFFQGNPWDGFQIYTVGSGASKTLVTDNPTTTLETGGDISVKIMDTSSMTSGTQSNAFLFHKAFKSYDSTYFSNYDTDYAPFNLTPAAFNTYIAADTKNGYDSYDARRCFHLNYRADFAEGPGIAYWNPHVDEGSAFILKPVTELKYVYNLWDDAYSTTEPRYTTTVRVLHGLTKTLDFRNVDGVNWIRDFCTYTRTQDYDYDGNDISATSQSIKMWTRELPNNITVAQAAALRAKNTSNEAVITRDIRYTFTLFNTAADVTSPTENELYYLAVRPEAYGEVADDYAHTVLHNNGEGNVVTAPQTFTDGDDTVSNYKGGGYASQKWFFAGNPYDGFRIMNLEATSTLALAAGTSHTGSTTMETYDPDDTDHSFLWRPDSCYISGSNYLGGENVYGFRFHERNCFNLYAEAYDQYRQSTGYCLNRTAYNIAFWAGNDIGSRFFVVPVATDQTYIYNIVDDEGNIMKDAAGNDVTKTVTITQTNSATYNLTDLQRDFCSYTLDGEAVDLTQSITHSNPNGEGLKETFNIVYHWDGPFELSTSATPVWYLLKMKSDGFSGSTGAEKGAEAAAGSETTRNYVVYDQTRTSETDAQGFKTQNGWNDELNLAGNYVIQYINNGTGLWAFEGDPYSNFKLINRSDRTKALTAINTDDAATYSPILTTKADAVKWEIGQNSYNDITTGFYIRAIDGKANDYLNYRAGKLSYWQSEAASTGVGSQCFVEEMTPYVLTYMGRYINAPENTFYGLQPSVQRNFADNYADFAAVGTANGLPYAEASDDLPTVSSYIFSTQKTQPADGFFRLLFKERNVYASLSDGSAYNEGTETSYTPSSSTNALLYGNISASDNTSLIRNLSSVFCFTKSSEDATLGTVNGTLAVQGMMSPANVSQGTVRMSSEANGEVRLFTTPYAPYTFISTNAEETSLSSYNFYHRNNQSYIQTWTGSEKPSILYVVPAVDLQIQLKQAIDGRLYTTLCVPYPVTLASSKATAYYISDALTLSSDGYYAIAPTVGIKNVPAGTPVIIAAAEPDFNTSNAAFVNLEVPNAVAAATYSSVPATNVLQGTYMPITAESVKSEFSADEKLYVFSQGRTFAGNTEVGFFPYSGTNLNPNRVYLVYDHVAAKNASAGSSAPRAIVFDIDGAAFDVAISAAGYSTLYYDLPLVVPEGVEAAIVNVTDEQLNIDYCYPAGSVIPAETGVLIKGDEGHYIFTLTDEDGTSYAGNQLRGSTESQLTDEGGTAYKLAVGDDGLPGFYLGDPEGGRFVNQAYKAYLFLTDGQLVRGFNFGDAVSTGVASVNLTDTENRGDNNLPMYDAQGRRVGKNKLMPGVYIVNGKKVFIK